MLKTIVHFVGKVECHCHEHILHVIVWYISDVLCLMPANVSISSDHRFTVRWTKLNHHSQYTITLHTLSYSAKSKLATLKSSSSAYSAYMLCISIQNSTSGIVSILWFSALTMLIKRQERHWVCKNSGSNNSKVQFWGLTYLEELCTNWQYNNSASKCNQQNMNS